MAGLMARLGGLALALSLGSLSAGAAPAKPCCSPAQASEDLAQLFATLAAVHPQLYRQRSRKAHAEALTALNPAALDSPAALWRAAAPLVNAFGDGHTWLAGERDAIWADFEAGRLRFFPLPVHIDAMHQVTSTADPFRRGIPPGSRLLMLDGQPLPELIAALERYEPGERASFRLAALADSFAFALQQHRPSGPDFALVWEQAGQRQEQRVAGSDVRELQAWRAGLAGETKPAYSYQPLIVAKDTGLKSKPDAMLLDFREFSDLPAFEALLAEMFAQIQAKGITSLIVDLRQNGGGNSSLGDALLRWLSPKPFRQYSLIEAKVSLPVKQALGCDRPDSSDCWPELRAAPLGSLLSFAPPQNQPHPAAKRFKGKVYALIGPETFSSAADLAASLKDYGLATLIGEETGGLASSYGETHRFRLRHSGLEAGVSWKYFIRPSGDRRPEGVRPDLSVDASLPATPEAADPALTMVLKQLSAAP